MGEDKQQINIFGINKYKDSTPFDDRVAKRIRLALYQKEALVIRTPLRENNRLLI